MRVRLAQPMSGTRNGVPWPEVGSTVDLPEDEARGMLESGHATAVNDRDKPGPALDVPDDVNDAVEKFVPETARHEPSIGVENLPDEDRRPVMKNVGLTDDHEIAHGPEPLPKTSDKAVSMTENDPSAGRRSSSASSSSTVSKSDTKSTTDASKGGGSR